MREKAFLPFLFLLKIMRYCYDPKSKLLKDIGCERRD